jgi:hypothetical protein
VISVLPHSPDKPWRTTGTFPGPVFFEIIFAGLDTVVGKENDETNETVEGSVDKESTKQERENTN